MHVKNVFIYMYVYLIWKTFNFHEKNVLDSRMEKAASNAVETVQVALNVITWQAHVPKDACRDIREINVTKVR